jgi:hypothetical protein
VNIATKFQPADILTKLLLTDFGSPALQLVDSLA